MPNKTRLHVATWNLSTKKWLLLHFTSESVDCQFYLRCLCFGWHLIFRPSFIVHPTARWVELSVHDSATKCRKEKRTLTWTPQACLESPRGRQGKMQVGVRCRTCVYLAGEMQALAEVEEREGERRMGAMKADAEDTSTSAATIRSVFPCIVAYAHTRQDKRDYRPNATPKHVRKEIG